MSWKSIIIGRNDPFASFRQEPKSSAVRPRGIRLIGSLSLALASGSCWKNAFGVLWLACVLLFSFPTLAVESGQVTGLPMPRYASLKSGDVNMRTGPGLRYPIKWVYTRKELPVQIVAEFDVWRRVRDPDGAEGWVHKSALTGRRTAFMTQDADAHDEVDPTSSVVVHLTKGVVGQIVSCSHEICRLKFDDIKGYLPKSTFWGAGKDEVFN